MNVIIDNLILEVSSKEARNGDKLIVYLLPGEGTNVKLNVTFCFDDKRIGRVSDFSYQMKYKVEDRGSGAYSISYDTTCKKRSEGSSNSTSVSGFTLIKVIE